MISSPLHGFIGFFLSSLAVYIAYEFVSDAVSERSYFLTDMWWWGSLIFILPASVIVSIGWALFVWWLDKQGVSIILRRMISKE